MTASAFTRRAMLGSSLSLAACKAPAQSQPIPPLPPLKAIAPFPMGTCVMTGQLQEPAFTRVLTSQFGQITAEWQMKMESILKDDGGFDFRDADALAAFAKANGLRLHGHTLIWYSQDRPAFQKIDGSGAVFANAYRNYILAVMGRYRGQAVSWDVVNEPVAEDGDGYRDCLWRRNLGMDYVAHAFHHAREADPRATLFLNDYHLESRPKKRASFLALAEQLLKAGAPLDGLGTQSHLLSGLAPGAIKTAMRDLASLGLPIHVSEFDCSTQVGPFGKQARRDGQVRLITEMAEAFMALPARQRFAFTIWGVRDKDSWLRRPPNAGDGTDEPLLFADDGRPKRMTQAFVNAVTRG
ncbi:MAG: endo-1,4-beta-xylanase [Caulobacteraceae bacterium]